jgi:hypothetical protein
MSHLNRRNALTALGALSGLAAFPAAFEGALRQARSSSASPKPASLLNA